MRPVVKDLELTRPPGAGPPFPTPVRFRSVPASVTDLDPTNITNKTDTTDPTYNDTSGLDIGSDLPGDGPSVTGSLTTNLKAWRFFKEDGFGSVAFNCASAIQGLDNTSRATTGRMACCNLPVAHVQWHRIRHGWLHQAKYWLWIFSHQYHRPTRRLEQRIWRRFRCLRFSAC